MEQVSGWRWTLRIAGGVFLGQALFLALAYLIVPGLIAGTTKERASPDVGVSVNAELEADRLEAEADRTARER